MVEGSGSSVTRIVTRIEVAGSRAPKERMLPAKPLPRGSVCLRHRPRRQTGSRSGNPTRFGFAGKKKASEPKPKIIKPNHPKSIRYTSTMVRTKKHFRPPSSSSSSSSEEEEDDDEINHQVPTGRGKQLGNFGRGKQLNMASQQGRGKQLRA